MMDIEKSFRIMDLSSELGKEAEWASWVWKVPSFNFPDDYMVKIIPPFAGAVLRFTVGLRSFPNNTISVFLDGYGCLSYIMDGPYWEIYPNVDGDTERFSFSEHEEMLKAVDDSLRRCK